MQEGHRLAASSATAPSHASAAARLDVAAASGQRIFDALGEFFAGDGVAVSAFEETDGRWTITLHFRDHPDETHLREAVAAAAGASAAATLALETLPATDWARKSREGLTPVQAGRFVLHGEHAREAVRPNEVGIEIEAGLAFGTGHHGSTRGCLLALDRLVRRETKSRRKTAAPRARAVLDVGTGTGVLAIAAAKTLRWSVLASDSDPRAVAIARENARLNRVGCRIEVVHAAFLERALFRGRAPFGLIFANILLEPLQKLATPISRLAAENGHVVLAGLLRGQAAPALASYRARGFALELRIALEGWVTLVLSRRATARRCGERRRPI